jgi:eukaryotic-like serine/threonine-protein kinase
LPGVLRRGTRLGKYRVERSIGKGAFSEVFAARDTVEGRKVALKVAFDWVVREFGREAMEVEARIACSLSHPNVVATRNADWIEGRFVIASELARTHVYDYPRAWRSGAVALRIVRDVAAGLAHAHQRRLMHRDVKPENILVFRDGHAGITDFGVSRFLRPAESRSYTDAGTMGYMAPEQAYGKPTLASDVFSLGVIAYELLTGKLLKWPFTWPPERFDRFRAKVPEPLRPVLQRACAFDPRDRYPSAVELHAALEAAFHKLEVTRHAPTTRRRKRRPSALPRSPLAAGMEVFRKRHGRALGMTFACRRCQGPIAEAMSHCPWCGTEDNSFKELTSAPLVCGRCERGVLPEWTSCPWCYAGRFEGNGKPPKKDPRALRRCKRRGCPGRLRLFMRYCPVCKQKPGRPWRHEALPNSCPRCAWPTSKSFFRFCAWCGRHQRDNS